MTNIIKTKIGQEILVSSQDFEWLKKYKWHINNGYAHSSKIGYMHRAILKPREGFVTDHKNRNRLDNQRDNLREATWSENMINKQVKGGTVRWLEKKSTWRIRTTYAGKSYEKESVDKNVLIKYREELLLNLNTKSLLM